MPDENLKKVTKRTYLKMIENSVGSGMFKNFYVKDLRTGKIFDVCENGKLSCAFYVSSILTILGFDTHPHTTVETTVGKLLENGWTEVPPTDLNAGDIIVWAETPHNGGQNRHIGFYLDKDKVVSNSSMKGVVESHHLYYGLDVNGKPRSEIEKVLRYKEFQSENIELSKGTATLKK